MSAPHPRPPVDRPTFLKTRYGVGYVLSLVKLPHADAATVLALARRHVPSTELGTNVGSELSLRMPMDAAAVFPALFADIDARSAELGIASYAISITNMETVFLKIAHAAAADHAAADWGGATTATTTGAVVSVRPGVGLTAQTAGKGDSSLAAGTAVIARSASDRMREESMLGASAGGPATGALSGQWATFRRHFSALLLKRFAATRRDKRALTSQLFLPVLMVIVGIGIVKLPTDNTPPQMQLTTSVFNANLRVDQYKSDGANRVPYFPYKAGAATPNVACPGIDDFMVAMQGPTEANMTRLPVNALTTPVSDPYNFLVPPTGEAPYSASTLELRRMSAFLISDRGTYRESKYGAVVPSAADTLFPTQSATSAFPSSGAGGVFTYAVLHNTTARHGAPTFVNLVNTGIYRLAKGCTTAECGLSARTHPFPQTARQTAAVSLLKSTGGALIIIVAFSFIPASIALFVVKARRRRRSRTPVARAPHAAVPSTRPAGA